MKVAIPWLVVVCAMAGFGQQKPAYEVVSIMAAPPEVPSRNLPATASRLIWQSNFPLPGANMNPGLFSAERVSAGTLLFYAFGLTPEHVSGAPPWLWTTYSIRAKTPRPSTIAEHRMMLRTLLADEFGLVYHVAAKAGKTYALVAGKNVKLKPADQETGVEIDAGIRLSVDRASNPPSIVNEATRLSMAELAEWLSDRLEVPVADRTGIAGKFDFKLRLRPEVLPGVDTSGPVLPGTIYIQEAENYVRALRSDVGLDLETTRGTVETFVIDQIHRPKTMGGDGR